MTPLLISYYILVASLGVLAVVLLLLPLGKEKKLGGYHVARQLLALSYMTTAQFFVFTSVRPTGQVLPVIYLIMIHMQAHLLGLLHIYYINPAKITLEYIWNRMIWMVFLMFGYNLVRIFYQPVAIYTFSDFLQNITNLEVVVRVLWMVVFVATIVAYSFRFHKEERTYRKKTLDYYPEEKSTYMTIIRTSFVLSFLSGVLVLLIPFFVYRPVAPIVNYALLGTLICVGIICIHYPMFFPRIKPIVYEDIHDEPDIMAAPEGMTWPKCRAAIIGSGLYMDEGVTIQILAEQLGMDKTMLSSMVHANEKMNFNSFINGLRIEKAKEMLREHPNVPIADVSEAVGYATPSNFSRQFKLLTGMTPAEYKKRSA